MWLNTPGSTLKETGNSTTIFYYVQREVFSQPGGVHSKQEGQDGPGSLTWIFEITIAYFFFWGIETKFIILLSNFQKVTCKVHFEIWPSVSKGRIFKNSSFLYKSKYSPSTRAMFLDGSKFTNKFSKGSPKEHFGIFFFKSDQGFQRKRIFKNFIMSI